jgi:predicted  nucleic acid-binding Zn-ribbon protein
MDEDKVIKMLTNHDEQFDKINKTLLNHENQLDRMVKMLVNHEERLGRIELNMSTKDDINKMMNTLDYVASTVKKLDQENTFNSERIKRTEQDIRLIKPLVGLPV